MTLCTNEALSKVILFIILPMELTLFAYLAKKLNWLNQSLVLHTWKRYCAYHVINFLDHPDLW